ncbi:Transcriptional regulatory protein [Linnemannia gamsii]|uniref:Transcriptional regulatory protein n=1 Tax=Linnemannia gamsii TaxID=64522 RepID=A0ABQ7K4D2_9FUNG|nr:Transcriptional regulatory protein [Linnemannia gamsii]
MLEATSLRSRKQSFTPTEFKVNSNNSSNNYTNANTNSGTTRNASAKAKDKSKDKGKLSMTNDTKTSISEAVVTSDSAASKNPAVGMLALGHEAESSQGTPAADEEGEEGEIDEDVDTSMRSRSPSSTNTSQQETPRNLAPSRVRTSKLSAEDLNGGLLDGALDDEDEDMDGDTEDTEPVQDGEGTPATHEADDEEEEGEIDEDQEEENEEEEDDKPTDTDDDTHLKVPKGPNTHGTASPAASEDQDDGSNIGDVDADGDVALTEQEGDDNDDDEDEGTPAGQTDDEGSELPEDGGSHAEDGDDDGDGDGDEDEEEEDDDDDDAPATPKKDVTSFPHKPTLNRPQLIAEDLKDSGDELSDLSEFDDTDDSDDEEVGRSGKGKGSSSNTGGSAASTSASATATSASATTNSRPSLGGRKRSLRDTSRDTKEQEEMAKEIEEDEENNALQSDKESESEMAEEETGEEKGEGEEDGEEEEDLEKKQVYTEALEALSSIEVEFAHLRDKMYEERMLELETEVVMINNGTHPELSTLMREIEDKRDQRLRVARAWRTHLNEISQAEFEIKEYQAHCTFQSKKRELRTDLLNGVGQKQQQLRLELTLSESRARRQPMEKSVLVRARKHKRAVMTELRTATERYGFPASNDLRMIATVELDEDFAAMGIPRPVPQTNVVIDHGHLQGHSRGNSQGLGHEQEVPQNRMHERSSGYGPPPPHSAPMSGNMSSSRPSNSHRWGGSIEHSGASGLRQEVEIYEDGSRCKVDGIWYKPSDLVVVLDAVLGQYHAKYLFLANDEIMLQKTDGTKTRLHLNLFRARKLCMQPRP